MYASKIGDNLHKLKQDAFLTTINLIPSSTAVRSDSTASKLSTIDTSGHELLSLDVTVMSPSLSLSTLSSTQTLQLCRCVLASVERSSIVCYLC